MLIIYVFIYFQALEKIKNNFPVTGGHLEIIQEDRYSEVIDIMANHFVPDEPLSAAFGVVWCPDFEKLVLSNLKMNLSVMAVSDDTNEVMGIRICGVRKKTDTDNLDEMEDEPLRSLFKFLGSEDDEIDFFNRYGVSEQFHFLSLAVHAKYRRRGLGNILLGACVALAKELGFKAIKGEGTSNFSQRIYEKQGFESVLALPYNQFKYKGKYLSEGTGLHACTKIYVKLL